MHLPNNFINDFKGSFNGSSVESIVFLKQKAASFLQETAFSHQTHNTYLKDGYFEIFQAISICYTLNPVNACWDVS